MLGLVILLGMAFLCFYTAYLVIESPHGVGKTSKFNSSNDCLVTLVQVTAHYIAIFPEKIDMRTVEFSDICREFLGKIGAIIALVFSITVLIGAVLAYWVLMSNFLYFTGTLIYGE